MYLTMTSLPAATLRRSVLLRASISENITSTRSPAGSAPGGPTDSIARTLRTPMKTSCSAPASDEEGWISSPSSGCVEFSAASALPKSVSFCTARSTSSASTIMTRSQKWQGGSGLSSFGAAVRDQMMRLPANHVILDLALRGHQPQRVEHVGRVTRHRHLGPDVADHAVRIDEKCRALQPHRLRAVVGHAFDKRSIRFAQRLAGVGEQRELQALRLREGLV